MDTFITDTLGSWGHLGTLVLMVLENVFPPLPSEVIMPAAGAAAREKSQSLLLVIIAGTVGSLLGQAPWYGLARYLGTDRFTDWVGRHGHWVGLSVKDVRRSDRWFDKYNIWAVGFGRLIPGVRTLISVPAGLSEMPVGRFIAATAVGTAVWTAALAGVGYWLQSQSETVQRAINWAGSGIVLFLLAAFIVRVVRRRKELKQEEAEYHAGEERRTTESGKSEEDEVQAA